MNNLLASYAAKKGINIFTSQSLTANHEANLPKIQECKGASVILMALVSSFDHEPVMQMLVDNGLNSALIMFVQMSFASMFSRTMDKSLLHDVFYYEPATPVWKNDIALTEYFGSDMYSHFCATAFDAIVMYGVTIERMVEQNLDYNNGPLLLEELKKIDTFGVTGRVNMDRNGDRDAIDFSFKQIKDESRLTLGKFVILLIL